MVATTTKATPKTAPKSSAKSSKAKVATAPKSSPKGKARDYSKVPFGQRLATKFADGLVKAGQYGSPGNLGIERDHDLPWGATKLAVFKALIALGSHDQKSASTAKQVVAKSGDTVSARDVRHYVYHGRGAGLSQVWPGGGSFGGGYGYSVTTKGKAEYAKHSK